MEDMDALKLLRAEGHTVSAPDAHTGRVRVWIRGGDEGVEVEPGRELQELAEGKVTFDEIRARRDDEITADAE